MIIGRLVFSALLGHWLQHWGQFLTLFVGLMSATALFVGVQAINYEAQASYRAAETSLTSASLSYLRAVDGETITAEDYAGLRREGFEVSPLVIGRLDLGTEESPFSVSILGFDLLSLGKVLPKGQESAWTGASYTNIEPAHFFSASGQMILSQATLAALQSRDALGGLPTRMLITPNYPFGQVGLDIAVASQLLDKQYEIDRLLVRPEDAQNIAQLKPNLVLISPAQQLDLGEMSASFHLNLTAFSLLSFLVGLFVVYSGVSLAYQDRLGLFRSLMCMGVSRRKLHNCLLLEAAFLSILSGSLGIIIGGLIANLLMPSVASTLGGFYGANISAIASLRAEWIALGLAMAIMGGVGATLIVSLRLKGLGVIALRQGRRWLHLETKAMRLRALWALAVIAVVFLIDQYLNNLVSAFALMAVFLLGAALVLPYLLDIIIVRIRRFSYGAQAGWFWADSVQEAPRMALALMALLLSLSAHMGVRIMVDGYRETFGGFLEERLAADYYVRVANRAESRALLARMHQDDTILDIAAFWSARVSYRGQAVDVVSIDDSQIYRENWTFLSASPNALSQAIKGNALLVSEQFAHRFNLAVGDTISFAEAKNQRFSIAAIYADYGNMVGQTRLGRDTMDRLFKAHNSNSLGLQVEAVSDATANAIKSDYNLADDQFINQHSLKALAIDIFDQTFEVSGALGILTLMIAAIAFISNLILLSGARLVRLAPAWGMGIKRRRLAVLEGARSLSLAVITAFVAMPFGVGVAWILVARINLAAFGWRLPFYIYPSVFMEALVIAILTALLSSLAPAYRLATMPPARLAKEFAHEY